MSGVLQANKSWFLAAAAIAGLVVTIGVAASIATDQPVPFSVRAAELVCALFLCYWLVADADGRPNIFKPFDYLVLITVFSYLYVPYYFWRTRGAKGLLLLALAWIGWLVLIAVSAVGVELMHGGTPN